MTEKGSLVRNLKYVKLVIGNGFDLYCHLKTSYADFFRYDQGKLDYFEKWINLFKAKARDYINLEVSNHKEFWVNFERFDEVNVWDFYFYLISAEPDVDINSWQWCDIEEKIDESLSDTTVKNELKWINVFDLLQNKLGSSRDSPALCILSAVVYKKNNEKIFTTKKKFFSFLLSELNLFEKNFGKYIHRQHFDDTAKDFGDIIPNTAFQHFASQTIEKLCNVENLASIDSFNYDFVEIGKFKSIFRNINGNVDTPIFGIDPSTFPPSDPRFIFTKASRHVALDINQDEITDEIKFDNVIVFGHSLNKADYAYFFSILDKLDILNPEKRSKIVFAFSIFDSKKEQEIISNLSQSILRLLYDYFRYKGYDEWTSSRLLDILKLQTKFTTFKIPYVEVDSHYFRK